MRYAGRVKASDAEAWLAPPRAAPGEVYVDVTLVDEFLSWTPMERLLHNDAALEAAFELEAAFALSVTTDRTPAPPDRG